MQLSSLHVTATELTKVYKLCLSSPVYKLFFKMQNLQLLINITLLSIDVLQCTIKIHKVQKLALCVVHLRTFEVELVSM